ncbi:MAG: triphosphoribosyl-dephospho-CoA synthase CitG [Lachnospiraceae bacterium]|jgi:holo-ACP synthase/triphosphoribosyl-dephospho-CoA synthase
MNSVFWQDGPEITLMEVLDNREYRAERQYALLTSWQQTLVCLTLNIAGPQKINRLIRQGYLEGKSALLLQLQAADIPLLFEEESHRNTGYEGFFVVRGDAAAVKRITLILEDTHPLGRLYDFDVLSPGKEKLSRKDFGFPSRRCLLCEKPAFLCGRNRTHSAKELYQCAMNLLENYFTDQFSTRIAALFTKGMTYEVTTTPKPGLVDRHHTGSHKDMDIALFMDSIHALQAYFTDCTRLGIQFAKNPHAQEQLPLLFEQLRKRGQQAEADMLSATRGVNTHKGLIFSGGILCGACGFCHSLSGTWENEELADCCRKMLSSLSDDFEALKKRKPVTHGEWLYHAYGLKGIRGEAIDGFPTLFSIGLPVFRQMREKGASYFTAGRVTLLYLMAKGEDTNIIIRSDYDTFLLLQRELNSYLNTHPAGSYDESAIIEELDQWFLKKNISPGGSADLLALTYFLYFAEKYR